MIERAREQKAEIASKRQSILNALREDANAVELEIQEILKEAGLFDQIRSLEDKKRGMFMEKQQELQALKAEEDKIDTIIEWLGSQS